MIIASDAAFRSAFEWKILEGIPGSVSQTFMKFLNE